MLREYSHFTKPYPRARAGRVRSRARSRAADSAAGASVLSGDRLRSDLSPFESFAMEKWVCGLNFWGQSSQKDYFFAVIDGLRTSWSQPQRVNDEISRAKKIISNVRQFERSDMQVKAETEIRRLFRV
ncbi:hypothetical protein D0B32_14600 [Paraburkholderia sp. DHOC27]|nr:hypothetical protein D0B32_14600 [Paraburkholderia sp. DHOC27]